MKVRKENLIMDEIKKEEQEKEYKYYVIKGGMIVCLENSLEEAEAVAKQVGGVVTTPMKKPEI